MAKSKSTRRPRGGHPPVLARDQDGVEHYLVVADHPAGLVSIADDEMLRTMALPDARNLVLALVHAMGSYLPGRPISGSF